MSSLPSPLIFYNGFTFPTETETVGIRITPVYDAAGRTVVKSIYELTLKAIIAAGAAQDATLENIRNWLTYPGGELVYEGRGFGLAEINTVGGAKDLEWGPKPRVIGWKPIGGDQAAELEWQVSWCRVNCGGQHNSGVMEWNYKSDITSDHLGYSTRAVTGHIVIAQTRQSVDDSTIAETADEYLDEYLPEIPIGFQRQSMKRSLSYDKCRCDYSYSDVRLTAPYPPGVGEASASHRLNTIDSTSTVRWQGTISASYKTLLDADRSTAFGHFIDLLQDRFVRQGRGKISIIPLHFEMSEPEIYGPNSAEFSFTYSITKRAPNFFPTGSLWRPVGSDFNRWATSVSGIYPRGADGLRERASEDAIVDLCLTGGASVSGESLALTRLRRQRDETWERIANALGRAVEPTAAGSWLKYECRMVVGVDDHVTYHAPFFDEVSTGSPGQDAEGIKKLQSPDDSVQAHTARTYRVRLIGQAARYGYQVPQPILESYAGQKCVEANAEKYGSYWEEWIGSNTTEPICCAQWDLSWVVLRGKKALGEKLSAELVTLPGQKPVDVKTDRN